jgi:rubrerythrin
MSDDPQFQITSTVATLNLKRQLCDTLRSGFSRYGTHNAFQCLDYELAVRMFMRDKGQMYAQMIARLDQVDREFGSGVDPRYRDPPDKISKTELERRYEILIDYEAASGRLQAPRQGGDSVASIHLYGYRSWQAFLVPFLRQRIEKDMNSVFAFFGVPGSAKSMSCMQLLRALDPTFSLGRIALSQEDFFEIEGKREETRGRGVMEDDMSRWSNSRTYGSDDNIITAEMFDTFRFKNEFHGITTPRDSRIDKAVREHIHLVFLSPDNESQGIFQVGVPEWGDDGKMKSVSFLKFSEPGVFFQPGECDPFEWVLDTIRFANPMDLPDSDEMKQLVMEYLDRKQEAFWKADQRGRELVEIGKMKKELEEMRIRDEYNSLPEKRRKQQEKEGLEALKLENAKKKLELEKLRLQRQEENLRNQHKGISLRCTHCGFVWPFTGKGDKSGRTKCPECDGMVNVSRDRAPEFKA